jgi:hypothetical protein
LQYGERKVCPITWNRFDFMTWVFESLYVDDQRYCGSILEHFVWNTVMIGDNKHRSDLLGIWTLSIVQNPVNLSVIYHRQNPLDPTNTGVVR